MQHTGIFFFLLAKKNMLSIILLSKLKSSKSLRLEKEKEREYLQYKSLSSTIEVGAVIPYPRHWPKKLKGRSGHFLVGFLEVLLSLWEILVETVTGD